MSHPDENTKEELRTLRETLEDAVADLERVLWLSGLCKYCAKGKGKGNRNIDRGCPVCEPKWRGPKKRRKPLWRKD